MYSVALPIGNAKDLSLRAQETLKTVDWIAAEDTRAWEKIRVELNLPLKPCFAFHDHNEEASALGLIQLLEQGQIGALVSDAGTPQVSDPGHHLLRLCFLHQVEVQPIPGASSLTSALSVTPVGGTSHFFGGFLPSNKNDRRDLLQKLTNTPADRLVFFESPHRIQESLEDIREVLGNINMSVHREMTKQYEEHLSGMAQTFIDQYKKTAPRGEFVLVLKNPGPTPWSETELKKEIVNLFAQGFSARDIRGRLQDISLVPRQVLFDWIENLKPKSD
ncbi:MAG: 16S rRNA (cytidine(1402)-2'-O)-methyltransferase [Bdellovibrionales bacterium]|nr:16S rRNA (cytidine(1402)-2'-O)-methyltransferase [Bdellovibrionales bacterium]